MAEHGRFMLEPNERTLTGNEESQKSRYTQGKSPVRLLRRRHFSNRPGLIGRYCVLTNCPTRRSRYCRFAALHPIQRWLLRGRRKAPARSRSLQRVLERDRPDKPLSDQKLRRMARQGEAGSRGLQFQPPESRRFLAFQSPDTAFKTASRAAVSRQNPSDRSIIIVDLTILSVWEFRSPYKTDSN